jgi:hypothetical protein
MMKQIHALNQKFDNLDIMTRYWLAIVALLSVAIIGAFVFHNVAAYFIGSIILIALRRI